MKSSVRVFVAGHRGLVGSAIERRLRALGANLLLRSRAELDLADARSTAQFLVQERPTHAYLCAAKVGGIHANNSSPVEFLRENLAIQDSVIGAAHAFGVERLLFLGSSCIYPRLAEQPIKEDALLSGSLEPTNRAYAIAKIAGIQLCRSMNRQHHTSYLCAMPTNVYGRGDNYHPENGHVLPSLLRRFHDAKMAGLDKVSVWGSGRPRREFLHSDDLAAACVHLMDLPESRFRELLGEPARSDGFDPLPVVNVGAGSDLTIAELAAMVVDVVGFKGDLVFDPTRPDGTPRKLLDSTKVLATGWEPEIELAAGLDDAYADFLARFCKVETPPRVAA